MTYSREDIEKYRKEFKTRQSKRIVLLVFTLIFLLVVGFIAIPLMEMFGVEKLIWGPFVYLVMFGLIIAIAFVWRCPVCNALLGNVFATRYCSKCGFKFTEDT